MNENLKKRLTELDNQIVDINSDLKCSSFINNITYLKLGNLVQSETEQFLINIQEKINPPTKDFVSIDLNELNSVFIRDIIVDFNENGFHSFELYEDEKVALVFHDYNQKIQIVILDIQQLSFRYRVLNRSSVHNMSLRAVKNSLIFDYTTMLYCKETREFNIGSYLAIFDYNLNLLQTKNFSENDSSLRVLSMDADDSNIYCFTLNQTITVLDHGLTIVRSLQLPESPQQETSFFNHRIRFSNLVYKMVYNSSRCYCLYEKSLDIIDANTGLITRSIKIFGSTFSIDSEGNIYVLLVCKRKIHKYNPNLILEDKYCIESDNGVKDFRFGKYDRTAFFTFFECVLYF